MSCSTHSRLNYLRLLLILSSISAIADPYPTYPVVTRILTLVSALQEIIHCVNIVWVPSYKGVQGNAKVDFTAKSTTRHPRIHSPALLPKSDINLYIRSRINQCCTSLCSNQVLHHNKLAQLKSFPLAWPSSQQFSCRAEVALTLLRIYSFSSSHPSLIPRSSSLLLCTAPPQTFHPPPHHPFQAFYRT